MFISIKPKFNFKIYFNYKEPKLKMLTILIIISNIISFDCNGIKQMPSSSSPFLAQSSTKSSVNNKTIVQAYPAIIALNGSQVSIPCNISHYQTSTTKLTKSTTDFVPPTNGTNDTPNLILWYRGEDISGSPIYTVDGRDQNVRPMWQLTNETNGREATKRHFIAPELSKRARVDLSIRPAMLIIDNIDSSDSGIYWCRVDFRWTRTLISMVELQVNVVPSSMYIWAETLLSSINLDQTKSDSNSFYSNSPSNDLLSKSFSTSSTTLLHQNYTTSSINNNNNSKLFINANEGGNLRLFCESYGGVPTPSVIWFDDNGNVQQSSTYQFNVTNIGDVQSFYETIVFPSQNEHEIDHWKRTIQLEQKSNRRPTITASNGESTLLVISVMTLYRLNRTQSQANFSCLANNTNLAPAIKRTIQIDLNLHPSHVTINPPSGSYLSDGLKTEVNCRAYGGRPYSLISWFLDQENITHLSDYDFEVNFTTSSVLKFTPNWKNDQRRLVCLAYNPTIVAHSNVNRSTLADVMTPIGVEPSNARIGINGIDSVWHTLPMGHHHLHHQQRSKTFVTDSLVLDIKYVPQIKLIHRMPFLPAWHNYQPQIAARYFRPNYTEFDGIMVDRNRMSYVHVDEGGNVTLDCILIAKPIVTVVRWTHNLAEIWHETEGIEVENQTLKITNAKRVQHEGIYRCVAFNSEGRGVSNEIKIMVDYAPRCQSSGSAMGNGNNNAADQPDIDQVTGRPIYYAKIGQTVNITCDLDARPAHNVTFYWTLNNQISERLRILATDHETLRRLHDDDDDGNVGDDDDDGVDDESRHRSTNSIFHWNEWQRNGFGTLVGPMPRSVAQIVPRDQSDFGMIRCWARNPIGYQATPCMFVLKQLSSQVDNTIVSERGTRPLSTPTDTIGNGQIVYAGDNDDDDDDDDDHEHDGNIRLDQFDTMHNQIDSIDNDERPNLPPSSRTSLIEIGKQKQRARQQQTKTSIASNRVASNHDQRQPQHEQDVDDVNLYDGNEVAKHMSTWQHQPQMQQHRLLNHQCRLNRTTHSVALNCTIIESSRLSMEILYMLKNRTQPSKDVNDVEPSVIMDSGNVATSSSSSSTGNLIWSRRSSSVFSTFPPLPPSYHAIVTYLIELYDNQDNLLSGQFITSRLRPITHHHHHLMSRIVLSSSSLLSSNNEKAEPTENGPNDALHRHHQTNNNNNNLYYNVKNLTSNTWYKIRIKTFLRKVKKRRKDFPINNNNNNSVVKRTKRKTYFGLKKNDVYNDEGMLSSNLVRSIEDDEEKKEDEEEKEMEKAPTMEEGVDNEGKEESKQMRKVNENGKWNIEEEHSLATTYSFNDSVSDNGIYESTIRSIYDEEPNFGSINGTLLVIMVGNKSVSTIDKNNKINNVEDKNGNDNDQKETNVKYGNPFKRETIDSVIQWKKPMNFVLPIKYHRDRHIRNSPFDVDDDDYYEDDDDVVNDDNDETQDEKNKNNDDESLYGQLTEMDRFNVKMFPEFLTNYNDKEDDVNESMIIPKSYHQRDAKRILKKYWKLYSIDIIRFRTLSDGSTNIGFFNGNEQDEQMRMIYRTNDDVRSNQLPEIVSKSLMDQELFRPMFILLSMVAYILMGIVSIILIGYILFKVKMIVCNSSSISNAPSLSSPTNENNKKELTKKDSLETHVNTIGRICTSSLMNDTIKTNDYEQEESTILYQTHYDFHIYPNEPNDIAGFDQSMLEMNIMVGEPLTGNGFTILGSTEGQQFDISVNGDHSINLHQSPNRKMLNQLIIEHDGTIGQPNDSSNNSNYSTMTTNSSVLGSIPASNSSNGPNASIQIYRYGNVSRMRDQPLADIVELAPSNITVATTNTTDPMLNFMMIHQSDDSNEILDTNNHVMQEACSQISNTTANTTVTTATTPMQVNVCNSDEINNVDRQLITSYSTCV